MTTISQTLDQTINAREAASQVTQDYRTMVRMNQANTVAHKARLNELTDTFSSKNMRKQYGFFGKTKRKVVEKFSQLGKIFHKVKAKFQTSGATKPVSRLEELRRETGITYKPGELDRIITERGQLPQNRKIQNDYRKLVRNNTSKIDNSTAKTAEKAGKGFWNWLTKTTAGKWTAAGVAVAAVGAVIWATLSGDKEAENTNKVNTTA